MKVVVAMDSFKGSLTSLEAGNSVKEGILEVFPHANICVLPLADGGEGTLDAVMWLKKGKKQKIQVKDALLRTISTEYGILNSNTALIEIAKVVGLPMLKQEEKNPLVTSTYGIGEMIVTAMNDGGKHFYIALGGSSTNDGGFGMLRALGYRFLNTNHQEIATLEGLLELASIDEKNVNSHLLECDFVLLSDVKNPLLGENGCSYVFGAQKGATKAQQAHLDAILTKFSLIVSQQYQGDFHLLEGAGAAGGLGFAFLAFLKAQCISGSGWLLKEMRLEEEIQDADYVITGEGKIDQQTLMGKGPNAVASLAKKYHKPVFGFGGSVEEILYHQVSNFDGLYAIIDHPFTLNDLKKDVAKSNIKRTVKKVFQKILK